MKLHILCYFVLVYSNASMMYFCFLSICLNFQCLCNASYAGTSVKLVEAYGRDSLGMFFQSARSSKLFGKCFFLELCLSSFGFESSCLYLVQVISYLNDIFDSLLRALSDPSDEVNFLKLFFF